MQSLCMFAVAAAVQQLHAVCRCSLLPWRMWAMSFFRPSGKALRRQHSFLNQSQAASAQAVCCCRSSTCWQRSDGRLSFCTLHILSALLLTASPYCCSLKLNTVGFFQVSMYQQH